MTMEIILSIHISTTLSCESLVLNIIKYEPHAFLLSLGLLQNLSRKLSLRFAFSALNFHFSFSEYAEIKTFNDNAKVFDDLQ